MLKAYANNKPMQAQYLQRNGITNARIIKNDGMFELFLTGANTSIGFAEVSKPRKKDIIQYWADCKVDRIVLDTICR